MQKYVFPLLVSEPPHNSTQGRLPCSLPVVTAFADITCHHISGEVVVNRFPQRRDRLAHKIIQDIAVTQPTPYCSGNHKFLSLPLPKCPLGYVFSRQPRNARRQSTPLRNHAAYTPYCAVPDVPMRYRRFSRGAVTPRSRTFKRRIFFYILLCFIL